MTVVLENREWTPKVGDWFRADFGDPCYLFYVLDVDLDGTVWATSPKWCVSRAKPFSIDDLKRRRAKFCGESRLRFWWRFLPWRDVVVPFTTPKSVKKTRDGKQRWWK